MAVGPAGLAAPGSIPARWKGLVVDDREQLNVISYELCVLIWVEGADRYRNPARKFRDSTLTHKKSFSPQTKRYLRRL